MAFKSCSMGRIYLVHWTDAPKRPDVLRINDDIECTRRAVGRPLVALSVVSLAACRVDRAAQAEMLKRPRVWHDNCESINIVLQADGFAATIARTLITQISLDSEPVKRGMVRIFRSIDAAIERVAQDLKRDVDDLRHQISRTGIMPYVAA